MAKRKPTRRLTDLELEVMQVVWDADAPVTVREVVDRMNRAQRKPLAYTTVQTMMNILKEKGVLSSRSGPGRALVYSTGVSREQATDSMTSEFVDRLFGGSAQPLFAHLLGHESVDRDTLEDLKRRIEEALDGEEDE